MSFGNRNVHRSGDGIKHRGLERSEMHLRPTSSGFDIGGFLMIVSVGVIVVSIATIVYLLLFNANPKPPLDPELAALFKQEPRPVARTYKTPKSWSALFVEPWMLGIKVDQTETGLSAIDSELHERCTKRINKIAENWTLKKGKAYFRIKDGARFLDCSMQHQLSRFCKPYYRERMVKRINNFVKALDADKAFNEKMRKNKMAMNMARVASQVNSASKKKSGGIQSNPFEDEKFPQKLKERIRFLSEKGLLTQSDFSGAFRTPPEELEGYLVDRPHACG